MLVLGALGIVVLALILSIPLALLYAWALQIIWNWYFPAIFGVDLITFGEALGLALVVTYLTHQVPESVSEDGTARLVCQVARPLIIVAFAWFYLLIWPVAP